MKNYKLKIIKKIYKRKFFVWEFVSSKRVDLTFVV